MAPRVHGAVPATTVLHHHLHEDEELNQLPPLFASMAIDGLPPFHQTVYIDEAEQELTRIASRWNIPSFTEYCRLALFTSSVAHSKVIRCNRLVDISLQYCLVFLIDDLLFDRPNDTLLEGYGISRSASESPQRIQACLDSLNAIFSQLEPPRNPTKIEGIVWELGHDMRQLSSPDWFRYFAKCVVDYHQGCIDSLANILAEDNVDLQDLDSNPSMDETFPIWKSDVATHFGAIKELISGGLYYHSMHRRYRHPDSIFRELRDVTHRKVQTSNLLIALSHASLKIVAEPVCEADSPVAVY